MKNRNTKSSNGFTIVELLVVIAVIAILAALITVSYSGVVNQAMIAAIKTDLSNASQELELYFATYGSYPTALGANYCPTAPRNDLTMCLKASAGHTFDYTSNGTSFGLNETNTNGLVYNVTDSTTVAAGAIITSSPYIQTITSANCPLIRTQVQDARDSHSYWVQKLADGKCWMLTNLGYAGSGTNTYGDTKTLTNGTGGASSYTVASYYVTPSTANFTTEPIAPSVSTDGTGQYGYMYNLCGANGGQTGNGACSSTLSTAVDTAISVCPSGWRLPTGNGGEFNALNTAINAGSTTTSAGLIADPWLGQRGGYWNVTFNLPNTNAYYWSSTQYIATNAYRLEFTSNSVGAITSNGNKPSAYAVRCIAI